MINKQLGLSEEEIQELRENKRYLAAQATQKLKRLKAKEQTDKILQRTISYSLRPDKQRVIAEAFKELINQCGYDNFNIDGDHGILVINVRDVLGIIEVLENE